MLALVIIWLVVTSAMITVEVMTKPSKKEHCIECGKEEENMVLNHCSECLFWYGADDGLEAYYNLPSDWTPQQHDWEEYYKDLVEEIKED